MKIKSKYLSNNDVANSLDVSPATVRNWIKSNYLKPLEGYDTILFDVYEVDQLKIKIEKGKIKRLSTRANKLTADRTFIPEEYLHHKSNIIKLNNLINFITSNNLEINITLFLLSIKLMIEKSFILSENLTEILSFKDVIFKNNILKIELHNWFKSINNFKFKEIYNKLVSYDIPIQEDILGLIYQSLLQEGEKSKSGSYYTPKNIVEDIISEYANPDSKILDPCCGSGQFLLCASKIINNPSNLYGFDIDEIAVRITRLNLLLRYENTKKDLNIFKKNTLIESNRYDLFNNQNLLQKNFDLIITNPPWGGFINNEDKKTYNKLYPSIKSCESFSYFLRRGIDLLKQNGILSFILPESILNVKVHKDIREIILSETSIVKIIFLGRVFKNVFTPVIRLDLLKSSKNKNETTITKKADSYKINQDRFKNNNDFVFDINANGKDSKIIKKIYKTDHVSLKGNAEWALGIVTGNNTKYILSKPHSGYEEIYKGKDIDRFKLKEAKSYVKFEPKNFQQVAPESKYRVDEKLIYRFISKKLIFAYDDQKRLTLNSANIVIPKLKNYPIKVILGLFNSSLYQFLFQKKFSSIKVLRSHIEQLPLPLWSKQTFNSVIDLVDKITNDNISIHMLNNYIMDQFKLDENEKEYINNFNCYEGKK